MPILRICIGKCLPGETIEDAGIVSSVGSITETPRPQIPPPNMRDSVMPYPASPSKPVAHQRGSSQCRKVGLEATERSGEGRAVSPPFPSSTEKRGIPGNVIDGEVRFDVQHPPEDPTGQSEGAEFKKLSPAAAMPGNDLPDQERPEVKRHPGRDLPGKVFSVGCVRRKVPARLRAAAILSERRRPGI